MYARRIRKLVSATFRPTAPMQALSRWLVLSLFMLALISCGQAGPQRDIETPANPTDEEGVRLKGTGTVVWHQIEGGFFVIHHEDKTYDPMNLPRAFRADGLRVYFEATVREDLVGTHMVGPLIELQIIRRIESETKQHTRREI